MKKAILRDVVCMGIFFVLICTSFNHSWASEKKYPSRSIEILNSFPPGGPVDLQTRILANRFQKEFGIPVVTVNKPGGGGSLAAGILANSSPDGYTLALMAETSIMMPILLKEGTFKLEDFRPIGQVNRGFPVVVVVRPDSPWKTFKEFVDYAKRNPGVRCGHPPVTTTAALKMSYLNKFANLGLVGLPFKTDPEIFSAIMGKHIPIAVSGIGGLPGLVEAGKLRVLFSFHPAADIDLDPTIPDFESFFGKKPFDFAVHLWAPAKTPTETVQTLKKTLEKIVKSPEFEADMKKIQYKPYFIDGDILMKKVLPDSYEKLKEILKETGLMK